MAAQQQTRLLFVFRSWKARHEASPAPLRLLVDGVDSLDIAHPQAQGAAAAVASGIAGSFRPAGGLAGGPKSTSFSGTCVTLTLTRGKGDRMYWIALLPSHEDERCAWGWRALQFTPRVAQVEEALVLEASAALRLWGGRQRLAAKAVPGMRAAAGRAVGPCSHCVDCIGKAALAIARGISPGIAGRSAAGGAECRARSCRDSGADRLPQLGRPEGIAAGRRGEALRRRRARCAGLCLWRAARAFPLAGAARGVRSESRACLRWQPQRPS